MRKVCYGLWLFFWISLVACRQKGGRVPKVPQEINHTQQTIDSIARIAIAEKKKQEAFMEVQKQLAAQKRRQEQNRKALDVLSDTTFVDLETLSEDFEFALKYATSDNFLKQSVYDCPKCYVRVPVAKALLKANASLMRKGYKIKFFDCYRPYSVQKKMWDIFPNPYYLANPKKGSIHNRGGAVDLTLATLEGTAVDMGTDFDHFGEEAHHTYTYLPDGVLEHRQLLRKTMEAHGFWTIRTEWWHYNYRGISKSPLADFVWDCDGE